IFRHDIMGVSSEQTEKPVAFSNVEISSEDGGPAAGSMTASGIEFARAGYHDFDLWSHYTGRMGSDLGNGLIAITLFAGSDGKRGLYMDRVAGVSRMFVAALIGDAQAKRGVLELPSMPYVASEAGEHAAYIESFLALCN